jgi:hypothetical protein
MLGAADQEEVVLLAQCGELSFDVEEYDLDFAECLLDDLAQRVTLATARVCLPTEGAC